ncbi:MAG: LysR family transcriptional regulator [Pseudomonadota bacterium]
MTFLNYHHLRYFWAVAHDGNLTRTAERLNLSQSALSVQIRKLEEAVGHKLFERRGRQLRLTEAGRIALDHADAIFKTGEELLGRLQGQAGRQRRLLRVGAITTLSRNFQLSLLRPLIDTADVELVVRSGTMRDLLAQLESHGLDLVLSNQPVPSDAQRQWLSQLIQAQPVSLVGPPQAVAEGRPFCFPEDLAGQPVLLPSLNSDIRIAFDRILELAGVLPLILAEVDDMAMLRLLARESRALALVPPVVVRDELRSGLLVEHYRIPQIVENFYAITQNRRFANPLLREILEAAASRPASETAPPS